MVFSRTLVDDLVLIITGKFAEPLCARLNNSENPTYPTFRTAESKIIYIGLM